MMKEAEIFLPGDKVENIKKWGFYVHLLLIHPDFAVRSLNSTHHPRSALAFIPPAVVDLGGGHITWHDLPCDVVPSAWLAVTKMPIGAIFVDSRDNWMMCALSTIQSLQPPVLCPDSPIAFFIDSHDL